jgi:D-aminopeptidase
MSTQGPEPAAGVGMQAQHRDAGYPQNLHQRTPSGLPRARALGLSFRGTPGTANAITDVPGIEVGYQTLIHQDNVRTGVTAIHPRGKANPGDPVAAGFHSQNGNGEMTGVAWIEESGTFSGPIAITNTHAVGIAHAGIIAWANRYHPEQTNSWLLPVAAETWDGYLNDINGHHVTEEIVIAALEAATTGPIDEGSVGGGTGMNCYQFKAGSGTSSRVVDYMGTAYTVGVFVQANFGRRDELTVTGVYLGEELADDNPMRDRFTAAANAAAPADAAAQAGAAPAPAPAQTGAANAAAPAGAGSVIAVVATDAPLFPSQAKAFARRVTSGLARTGTSGSHYSGDLFLAFSTANPGGFTPGDPRTRNAHQQGRSYDQLSFIPWGYLDPFYEAVVQATEEAVLNSLVANKEMIGRDGHRSPALPRDRVAEAVASRHPPTKHTS